MTIAPTLFLIFSVSCYREGGPGYYALDVTQPDRLDSANVPLPDATYVPSCDSGGASCGNREFPAVLWEFQDEQAVELSAGIIQTVRLDEDLNNQPDLANTWSKPTIGRIRVCTGACADDETEDRYVAIFGGGVGDDPDYPTGNFIYMVDIETGKVTYKKPVLAGVPAPVAAIDSDGDIYIDRLYVGTTGGLLYKVLLEGGDTPMRLASQTLYTRIAGCRGEDHGVRRRLEDRNRPASRGAHGQAQASGPRPSAFSREATAVVPVSVEFDNETSDTLTIIDISARDRVGLLYRIAKTLYDLNLDIASAKIVTEGVRVSDAFYVSDLFRAKISAPDRLAKIRGELMKALE